MTFDFRPFESHFEVHRKYLLSSSGKNFLLAPCTVMFIDPQSNVVDVMLGVVQKATYRKTYQNRGKQLKPWLTAALENSWTEGCIDKLKFLGLHSEVCDYVCYYFLFLLDHVIVTLHISTHQTYQKMEDDGL